MKSNALRNQAGRLRDCLEYLGARPWSSFFLILSLALAVRVALIVAWPTPVVSLARGEAENIAATLATEGRFADPFCLPTGPSAHNPPFYPWLVALLYRTLGTGMAASWVRFALSVLAYSILYGLLPRVSALMGLPAEAGVVGGLALAVLPLRKSGEIGSWEDPYAAIALAFLLVWTVRLRCQDAPTWLQAALYGISWGALFYITPSPVVTYLGLSVCLLLSWSHHRRSVLWLSVAMLLSVLVVTPWTLRNRRELGGWMFMRSNLGLELCYGNNDAAQPTILLNNRYHRLNLHPYWSKQEARWVARVGELAYNREKLSRARAWIAAHPSRFTQLCAMRAGQMWFGIFEEPRWLSLPIAACTILGLLGLVALWRSAQFDQFAVIGVFWVTYPSVYFVFQYVNRYRGVFDWSIALLMGVFLISVLDRAARNPSLEDLQPGPFPDGRGSDPASTEPRPAGIVGSRPLHGAGHPPPSQGPSKFRLRCELAICGPHFRGTPTRSVRRE